MSLSDSKPNNWAGRGGATGGRPKPPMPQGSSSDSGPNSTTTNFGSKATPTKGYKTYPKRGK